MILPATGDAWAISRSTCSAVGLVVPGGNFRICRLLDCFYGMASIWSHETAHEQKQLRASPDRGVLSRPWCRFSSGRWHSRPTGDLIEVEAARHGAQLAESGAVSRLRTRLQGWQIIASEAFQSFLVGLAGGFVTVEPMVFIEKPGYELRSSGFRGGVAGSPARATDTAASRSICAYIRSPILLILCRHSVSKIPDLANERNSLIVICSVVSRQDRSYQPWSDRSIAGPLSAGQGGLSG